MLERPSTDFAILGPIEVQIEGRPVRLGPQLRVLLAVLVVARGRRVSTSALKESLWPDGAPSSAAATMRSHIQHLRRSLSSASAEVDVITEPGGYSLRLGHSLVDAERFEDAFNSGREALRVNPREAADLLHSALSIWRGEALEDLADRLFAKPHIQRLETLRRLATETRIEADLALGRHAMVVEELRELVANSPYHEPLRRLLALATYRSHGADEAAMICREGLQILHARGIESPSLKEMQQKILRRASELDWNPGADSSSGVSATPAIFEIRSRNGRFQSRSAELATIHQKLRAESSGLNVVALHGASGHGKSELAVEFAHRHRDDYAIVYWISADQPATIPIQLLDLARRLGIPDSGQMEAMVAELWQELQRQSRRWLLIYDGVDEPAAISSWLPPTADGHIIITSRSSDWGTYETCHVDVLSPDAAVALLGDEIEAAPGDAQRLARELGYLPLALEHAAAYISSTQTSAADYLSQMERGEREATYQGEDAGLAGVSSTVAVALRRLRSEAPGLEEFLTLCSFLESRGVPRWLFIEQNLTLPEPLASMIATAGGFTELLDRLSQYHLAKVVGDSVVVHPLLQRVVRLRLSDQLQSTWAATAVRAIQASFPASTHDAASWPVCEELLGHALVVTTRAELLGVEPQAASSLLALAADYVRRMGDVPQAIALLRRAISIHDEHIPANGPDVADMLDSLGSFQRELGESHAARQSLERAILIREARNQATDPRIANSLDHLGIVLFDLGDLQVARKHLERALTIRQSDPSSTPLDLARNLNALGLVLWALGDLKQAELTHQRALHNREEVLGPDHPEVATTLDNLAKVVADRGDLTGARAINERALAIRERRLGASHFHVGISLNHLGVVLRQLGATRKARAAHERALAIFEQRFGPNHSHVARSLDGLGSALLQLGQPEAAKARHEQALAIFSATSGPDSHEAAVALANLGLALASLGDSAAGRAAFVRAIGKLERLLGADHYLVVEMRQQLLTLQ